MALGVAAGVAAASGRRHHGRRGVRASAVTCRAVAVGDKVQWKGKTGTVAFVGTTKFAPGEWVGLELVQGGSHDGSVFGVEYFTCAPGKGAFAQESQLMVLGSTLPPSSLSASQPAAQTPEAEFVAAVAAGQAAGQAVSVGAKVQWKGKTGVVSYTGPVQFATGEWVGLELEEGGSHNGSVLGVEYFTCAEGKGAFTQASQLTVLESTAPASPQLAAVAPVAKAAPQTAAASPVAQKQVSVGDKVDWNGKAATVMYVGTVNFAAGKWVGLEVESGGSHDGSVFGVDYFTCAPGKGAFAQPAQLKVMGSAAPPKQQSSSSRVPSKVVYVGEQVRWNGAMGSVRFVGPVKFAAGNWVGLELGLLDEGGANDGSVFGVEYFGCASGKGAFVQDASQLTVLGWALRATAQSTAAGAKASHSLSPAARGTNGLSVGDKVQWNGKLGIVRFLGPVKFAAGEWVGLELESGGSHDGTVFNIEYFTCAPGKGAFAKADAANELGSAVQSPRKLPTKLTSLGSSVPPKTVYIGEQVQWKGATGSVRFVGPVKFASGDWVGLELEDGGKNDGSVFGVGYFDCAPGRGVFVQDASQLTVLGWAPPAVAHPPDADTPAGQSYATAENNSRISVGDKAHWNGKLGIVRFLGSVKFAAGEWVGLEMESGGSHDGSVFNVEYFNCAPGKGIFAQPSQVTVVPAAAAGAFAAPPAIDFKQAAATASSSSTKSSVVVGDEVTWSGKSGKVLFVGPVKFAVGEWIGLELDTEDGFHDGSVFGVEYFICAPRRGIFAQASQLTLGKPARAVPAPAAATAAASQPVAAVRDPENVKVLVGGDIEDKEEEGTCQVL